VEDWSVFSGKAHGGKSMQIIMTGLYTVVQVAFASTTESIISLLTSVLPNQFALWGGLLGIGLAIFYFKHLVARRKA